MNIEKGTAVFFMVMGIVGCIEVHFMPGHNLFQAIFSGWLLGTGAGRLVFGETQK